MGNHEKYMEFNEISSISMDLVIFLGPDGSISKIQRKMQGNLSQNGGWKIRPPKPVVPVPDPG